MEPCILISRRLDARIDYHVLNGAMCPPLQRIQTSKNLI